jgi:hypothetical protein
MFLFVLGVVIFVFLFNMCVRGIFLLIWIWSQVLVGCIEI